MLALLACAALTAAPVLDVVAAFAPQTPAGQGSAGQNPLQQEPALQGVLAVPPAAPMGEFAAPEAELGGNPEPVPTTRYALENLFAGIGVQPTLDRLGIRVYGWTQGSKNWSSAKDTNAPNTFDDRADYAQIDQNWLEVVKSIDTSKNEVQFGFRTAWILPGYDYKFTLARGMWNDQSDRYGFDTPYVYSEVFAPAIGPRGTTFRVGKWATMVGWEMIEAVATPFVSRSYNFQYNPFTHTGVQATTELSAQVVMYHGLVTGADVFFDPAATASYVGGVKWTREGGETSVAANVFVTGKGYDTVESFQHYDCYNLVLTQQLGGGCSWAVDTTYGDTNSTDPAGTAGGRSAQWWGCANYLSCVCCETVTLNVRAELFHDDDGARTGTSGDFVEATVGLQWMPKEWVMLRPFVRFDRNANAPFEGERELWTEGVEAIVRW